MLFLKSTPVASINLKIDSLADHSNNVWMSSLFESIDCISETLKNFSFRARTFVAILSTSIPIGREDIATAIQH